MPTDDECLMRVAFYLELTVYEISLYSSRFSLVLLLLVTKNWMARLFKWALCFPSLSSGWLHYTETCAEILQRDQWYHPGQGQHDLELRLRQHRTWPRQKLRRWLEDLERLEKLCLGPKHQECGEERGCHSDPEPRDDNGIKGMERLTPQKNITEHPRYVATVKSSLLLGGTSNVMNVYYLNEVNWLN